MYQNLAILGAFLFFYSIFSARLARSPVNGAVVYMVLGLVAGPVGLGWLHLDVDAEGLRTLAELTLALVLFTDAAEANQRELQHSWRIPLRLLLFGMPLTIGLGYVAGLLLLDSLDWIALLLLATMLAPTDAALGKAVVTDPAVPASMREGLNVESGLNDGICVPLILLLLTLAIDADVIGSPPQFALQLVSQSIGLGLVAGVVVTWLAVRLLRHVGSAGRLAESWGQLTLPALALVCFAVAQLLGGSGFIACFVGGILFGAIEKRGVHARLLEAESLGDSLALLTWVVFGAGVVGQALQRLSWEVFLYALCSLTVVRMLPVFLSLWGSTLTTGQKLFMGWFGPRGLASIVFAVIVFGARLPAGQTIIDAVVCTIVLSVLLHGLSANPLVGRLGARAGGSA